MFFPLTAKVPLCRLYSVVSSFAFVVNVLRDLTLFERALFPEAVKKGCVQFEPSDLSGTRVPGYLHEEIGVLLLLLNRMLAHPSNPPPSHPPPARRERKVYCPKTQHSDHNQGSNPDRSNRSPAQQPLGRRAPERQCKPSPALD